MRPLLPHATLPLVLVAALGCSRSLSRATSRVNTGPFRAYTEKLITTSGSKLTVYDCAMFGESRKGYCIVDGGPGEATALASALHLTASVPSPTFGDQSCLGFAGYGHDAGGSKREADPHVVAYRKGATPLPTNANNVRFVALYVHAAGASACVELDYPYG